MEIYILRNVSSGKIITAGTVHFVTFNEEGHGQEFVKNVEVGASVVLGLREFGEFTWQTTIITEVLESTKDHAHFLTQNSEYTLTKTKIKNELKKGKNNR